MGTVFGVGGITRHVLDLSGWLRARGHQLYFAGTPGPWVNREVEPDFLALETLAASGVGGGLPARLGAVARSAAALRRWLARHPVDLIHAHESAPALVAGLATLGLKVPIVVTYHGSERERVRQFGTIAKMAADLVITVSHRSARDLQTLGGVPESKLQVVGLGVKQAPANAPARIAAVRRELLGEAAGPLVVTVARLVEQKGVDVLAEVCRRVVADRPETRFALVGDGPLADQARAWAEAAGVSDRLIFVGHSEEPHLYLEAADLFLLTSRWEALPFTIVEAFRAGTPAVATDCGGVVELIDDAVGRVVPVGEVEAISRAVIELADDPDLRQRMAAQALARSAEPRFSMEAVYRQLEGVYRRQAARRER